MRAFLPVLLLLGSATAQDTKTAPPLLVIRELNDNRGATVKKELEAAFTKAGFRIALLTRELADDDAVEAWFKEVAKEAPFDRARVVILGFSAAGVEGAKPAFAFPKRFCGLILPAALVPVPDGADLKAAAPHLPVFLIYGESDTTAPPRIGETARKSLEEAGVGADWKLLPKADHFGVLKDGAAAMAEWASVATFCVSRLRKSDEVAAKNKADAKKLLEEIQKQHPKSRFAEQAKKRLESLK